ncbi:MAG TPA: sigma-70 family RNA polymerase sigma factor [Planctomycetaceae bacterium]|nr:sigma-70 family RNA polymerase sigma factor [Planctomycetaceae bacterium]
MPEVASFRDLFEQICRGDQQAARELLVRYERDLRILARVRLTDPNLRRAIDSMDVCQSVFGVFFARAAAGLINLETPEQFLRLMATMIHNKVIDYARRFQSRRRDVRRQLDVDAGDMHLPGHDPTASQVVSGQELLAKFQAQLTDEERQLAEMRKAGCKWEDIARELGSSPEALRKRLSRAIDRIMRQLREE